MCSPVAARIRFASIFMANNVDTKKVVSTWEWLVYFLILAIPVLNIIIVLVDAFGSNRNENKKNFCRAIVITFVLSIIASVVFVVFFYVALEPLLDKALNLDPGQQQHLMYELNRTLNTGK